VAGAAFYRSTYATGVNEYPPQPVAFSHAHHVGQLGISCLYCHTSVEKSGFANIPPTKTCMNCHQQIWQGSNMLEPVRESYRTDKPIEWNRVHNLPHYAYFNHSIHVAKGVGCASCHGRLDQQNLTMQASTLLMEWCIACHRVPEKHLRPQSEVFNMQYDYSQTQNPATGKPYSSQLELGLDLKEKYKVRDAVTLTNCSMCHR
jgi:ferredoxin